jgi:hypothetical protein
MRNSHLSKDADPGWPAVEDAKKRCQFPLYMAR